MSHNPWVAVDATTIPAKRGRELRDAWEDFVDGRETDDEDRRHPADPRPDRRFLAALARRGRRSDGRQAAPSVVELEGVRDLWHDHPLAVAAPLIEECMALASVEADHLTVVSDADGMLLSIRGDTRLRNRAADDMNFVEGALWSEAGAGTNAVGTALAADHAVQVFAAEHFTEPVQRWTCAAAPVTDPDTGRLLGIIDLTGDMASVHPHSLSVVVATARAIQELLQRGLRERDDRLRARYGTCCVRSRPAPRSSPRSGRVLLDPTQHWSLGGPAADPGRRRAARAPVGARGRRRAPRGRRRLSRAPARAARARGAARLELRLLGAEPEVVLDGRAVQLRRRHVELLTLLTLHRGPVAADVLCDELYGDDGHPASIRVEMSRLRKLLHGAIDPDSLRPGLRRGERSAPRAGAARPQRDRRRRGARTRARSCRSPTPRASAASARSSRAGCARRSSPPATPTPSGRGSGRPPATTTSLHGSACSPRSTTPIRAAASPQHGPQRSGARPCSGHVTPRVIH